MIELIGFIFLLVCVYSIYKDNRELRKRQENRYNIKKSDKEFYEKRRVELLELKSQLEKSDLEGFDNSYYLERKRGDNGYGYGPQVYSMNIPSYIKKEHVDWTGQIVNDDIVDILNLGYTNTHGPDYTIKKKLDCYNSGSNVGKNMAEPKKEKVLILSEYIVFINSEFDKIQEKYPYMEDEAISKMAIRNWITYRDNKAKNAVLPPFAQLVN